jgi:hypothetical protein
MNSTAQQQNKPAAIGIKTQYLKLTWHDPEEYCYAHAEDKQARNNE